MLVEVSLLLDRYADLYVTLPFDERTYYKVLTWEVMLYISDQTDSWWMRTEMPKTLFSNQQT